MPKQKPTDLNICLLNLWSVRNKTKDVTALLKDNENFLEYLYICGMRTTQMTILMQCCPPGFSFIVHQRLIKDEVENASSTGVISI